MDVRNCPECGKVFTVIRTNLCPACQQKDEENFKAVRMFIAKNPRADIIAVSEGTGVSEGRIVRYLREGRISAATSSPIKLGCEVCNGPITTGRYCKACNDKLTAGLKKTIEEENKKAQEELGKKSGPQMHTAEHWRR